VSIRYLSENEKYKLYSLHEIVYLKHKSHSNTLSDYEAADEYITRVYGDPDSGILSFDGTYIVVAGCGITVYFIETKECIELLNDPDDITWTEGVYQSAEDASHFVRFNALTDTDKLVINRLNINTREIELVS